MSLSIFQLVSIWIGLVSLIASQFDIVSLSIYHFIHVINAVLTLSFCLGAPGLPTSLIVFGLGDTRGVVRKG